MDQWIVDFATKWPWVATVVAGLLAAHTLATFIVNLTPTPKDDEILAKVYKVIEWLAGLITPKSKQ